MTIAPGLFETPLFEAMPAGLQAISALVPHPARLGHPDEFAHAVEAIVDNPMFNGEVVRLDAALRLPSIPVKRDRLGSVASVSRSRG